MFRDLAKSIEHAAATQGPDSAMEREQPGLPIAPPLDLAATVARMDREYAAMVRRQPALAKCLLDISEAAIVARLTRDRMIAENEAAMQRISDGEDEAEVTAEWRARRTSIEASARAEIEAAREIKMAAE